MPLKSADKIKKPKVIAEQEKHSEFICWLQTYDMKLKLRGLSPRANNTDREAAACWRS
jgi:hypothetical protein